jgi:hypothetical protein
MRQSPIAYVGRRAVGYRRARRLPALAAAFLLALGGCSSFNSAPATGPDPNINPASNYRAVVMTFLQTNAYGMTGAVSAELSPPTLRAFGTESRYVACLNVAGTDWRKQKMIVFYAGEINQVVDATDEGCKGAAFSPFPELPAMLAAIRSKQK